MRSKDRTSSSVTGNIPTLITPPHVELHTFLAAAGLRENPFTLREPDREDYTQASTYFFPHRLFPTILGDAAHPESGIVFARRGAGKTTFRIQIQHRCDTGTGNDAVAKRVLAVSYTEFTAFFSQLRSYTDPIPAADHVTAILRLAVAHLLRMFTDATARQFLKRPRSDLGLLKGFIAAYSVLLDPTDQGALILDIFRRQAQLNQTTATTQEQQVEKLLDPNGAHFITQLPVWFQPLAELIVRLQAQPARPLGETYIQHMRGFIELLQLLDYRALYVLVDRVDESDFLERYPGSSIQLIGSLLTDLQLLDTPGLALKFFLPVYLEPQAATIGFRANRLRPRYLEWGDDDLLAMLQHRLEAVSIGLPRSSLNILCDASLFDATNAESSVPQVDWALVQAAHNLPRDLIRRCQLLIDLYIRRGGTQGISAEDLHRACTSELPSDEPPPLLQSLTSVPALFNTSEVITPPSGIVPAQGIYIDEWEDIWCDGLRISEQVTGNQRRLLVVLWHQRGHTCKHNTLIDAIWGPHSNHSVADLNTEIARLRKDLDSVHKQSHYILNIRGEGYQLAPEG